MAAVFQGGEQRPRCEEEEGRKRGRRLFEAVDDCASAWRAFRRLWTPLSPWKARAWEKGRVGGREGVDGERVCADAADEVNEVQYLLQVQVQVQADGDGDGDGKVEYLNRWAGGEWPRRACTDEAAGLGAGGVGGEVGVGTAIGVAVPEAVKRVRWRAASKLRTLAAARQVAWNCKQVTPETGIDAPGGLKKQEPRMPCVCLLYLSSGSTAGDGIGPSSVGGTGNSSRGLGDSVPRRRSRIVRQSSSVVVRPWWYEVAQGVTRQHGDGGMLVECGGLAWGRKDAAGGKVVRQGR